MNQPSTDHVLRIRFICGIAGVVLLLSAASCGGEEKLLSRERDRDVVVDGVTKEWEGVFVYFEDHHANVGVMNDDRHIYVAFTVSDRQAVRQILVAGATLWFRTSPDNQSAFGIRYPRGIEGARPEPGEWGQPDEQDEPGEPRGPRAMGERDADSLLAQRAALSVEPEYVKVTSGRGAITTVAEGVEVAARYEFGALFYEAKVPLESVAGLPGGTLRLGLQGEQMPELRGGPPNGGAGGGRPSGGGPPGGGRSDGRPGGGFSPGGGAGGGPPGGGPPGSMERPEPIKIWFEVTLSQGAGE